MERKLEHFQLLKSKGKKTEFLKFEDIYKDLPNSTTNQFMVKPKILGRF